jgi:hypothetical protein
MEKGERTKKPAIQARPQELVNAGESFNKAQGGRWGDASDRRSAFGDGFEVVTSDCSPTQSWSHARVEVTVRGSGLDATMRAEDDRSGSDDPDRDFAINNNSSQQTWTYLDELRDEPRPEWVVGFLESLATATAELVSA